MTETRQIGLLRPLSVDSCPFQRLSVNLKELFLSGQVTRMMFDSFPVGWTAWRPVSTNLKGSVRNCGTKQLLSEKPRWELDFRFLMASDRLFQNAMVTQKCDDLHARAVHVGK